ncbi:MAG: hypothetical protein H6Q57_187 [Geobacteraceae bacterium]|jgi:hypothetical protein|nr:hypothetical protein [Geobacteraceae bacterium]
MPEQISKYPDVTLQILKEAGARCGEGVERKILKKCPPSRFCSLPTGEVCIYGIEDIPLMTQISTRELAQFVCPPGQVPLGGQKSLPFSEIVLIGAAFAAGLLVAGMWRTFKG